MVLDTEERQFFVAHAFIGVVVEIDVRDFNVTRGKRFGIDAKAVILRGNFDFLREQVLHGMIRAVMAEFQFEGFAAECEAAELMAKADTENGDATKKFLNIFDGVADGLGIAGAIGKENSVRL